MSKFNVRDTRSSAAGPIVTDTTPTSTTYESALSYARDAKSELFLLAVANMVGEHTFYETAGERDERYEQLVAQVAVTDADWTLRFLRWLRTEANMRSASLVGAAEAVHARRCPGPPHPGHASNDWSCPYDDGSSRRMIDAVLQRADEPGEMLAYWTSRYGRAVPKPVKRGIGDAVQRLYTEYNLLKYDTDSKGFRFGDVIDLVHPDAKAPWQGNLYRHALDRRHGRGNEIPAELPMLTANALLRTIAVANPDALLNADRLREAGMTWEDVLSLAGSKLDKGSLWSALIPTMGYMALLRNLRNFDQAGVPDDVAAHVAARLADPDQVARSHQFPFRFLAAYRNAPSLRWGHALDKALTASLTNVPALPGRTLVLVDRSGSMFYGRMSGRSELTSADAAAVFGSALALRNANRTDLVEFGTGSHTILVKSGDSLLRTVERFGNLGGTETMAAVQRHYAGHDRVVIVTDEQAWQGYGDPGSAIPTHVPLYTWNLVGYRHGHGPGKPNRHTFGGLTDQAFRLIPLLEAGQRGEWPF